jgi:uncharacterized RDD family membrane protein YckC
LAEPKAGRGFAAGQDGGQRDGLGQEVMTVDTAPQTPSPTAQPPADSVDVLGRRIAAALIDLALLVVLFFILGLTIGERSAEGGTASVNLRGGDAIVYFVLVLLYYFILEATLGRTVGKLALGLRVVGSEGQRPSTWAIIVRTVLRAIDGLPFLYLVGFITMLATGPRRLRLGDLAAKTKVVRV